MTTLIPEILDAVRADLASYTKLDVTFGPPADSKPGLCIFLYSVLPDLANRGRTPRRETAEDIDLHYQLHGLVMPKSSSDFMALDKTLRWVSQNPILEVDTTKVVLMHEPICTDTLTRIFLSAGISLTLAVPFMMRWHGNY